MVLRFGDGGAFKLKATYDVWWNATLLNKRLEETGAWFEDDYKGEKEEEVITKKPKPKMVYQLDEIFTYMETLRSGSHNQLEELFYDTQINYKVSEYNPARNWDEEQTTLALQKNVELLEKEFGNNFLFFE